MRKEGALPRRADGGRGWRTRRSRRCKGGADVIEVKSNTKLVTSCWEGERGHEVAVD